MTHQLACGHVCVCGLDCQSSNKETLPSETAAAMALKADHVFKRSESECHQCSVIQAELCMQSDFIYLVHDFIFSVHRVRFTVQNVNRF